MKHYCKKCHITHNYLITEYDEAADEQYDVCPSCRSDMDLIVEGQPGFIADASGKKKLFTQKEKKSSFKRWITEEDYEAYLVAKEIKEDAWIESKLKQQQNVTAKNS